MPFYKTCPWCDANLDPGEPCDCEQEKNRKKEFYAQTIRVSHKTGQLTFTFDRKDVGYATKGTF